MQVREGVAAANVQAGQTCQRVTLGPLPSAGVGGAGEK